jgi:hypothetical protein
VQRDLATPSASARAARLVVPVTRDWRIDAVAARRMAVKKIWPVAGRARSGGGR